MRKNKKLRKNKKPKIAKHLDRDEKIEIVLNSMRFDGLSLRKSCIVANLDVSTFMLWVSQDRELSEQYAKARESMLDKIADETMEIANERPESVVHANGGGGIDSAFVAWQRLRIDTRKWHLSKLAPKKYGDKLEVSGDAANPLSIKIEKIQRVIVDGNTKD